MENIAALFDEFPYLFISYAGLFGLLIGSFLGVVADRVPQGKSIVHPPSACDHCGQRVKLIDLIPILGYLKLKGRCPTCGSRIPLVYPFMEAGTGLLFAGLAYQMGFEPELAVGLLLVSVLIVITATDLREWLIPDKVLLYSGVILLLFRLFIHPLPLWNYIAAFFAGGGVLYLIAVTSMLLFRKEGMGGGDIKLFAWLGLALGLSSTLLTLFLAAVLGLVGTSIVRLFSTKTKKIAMDTQAGYMDADAYEDEDANADADVKANANADANTDANANANALPFGPYIALAALVAYFWGDSLLAWYLGFFI